jgi:hypothetical protein
MHAVGWAEGDAVGWADKERIRSESEGDELVEQNEAAELEGDPVVWAEADAVVWAKEDRLSKKARSSRKIKNHRIL